MTQNTLTAVGGGGGDDQLYVCPLDNCEYKTHWAFVDVREKEELVCPNDNEDLLLACYSCEKPIDEDGRCSCTNKDAYGV